MLPYHALDMVNFVFVFYKNKILGKRGSKCPERKDNKIRLGPCCGAGK